MTDCAEKVFVDVNGHRIVPPRTCRHKAKPGEKFCGLHRASRGSVASSDGGFCVWCAEPARRYTSGAGNAAIDLCAKCSDSLAREIRRYVPADRRRAARERRKEREASHG